MTQCFDNAAPLGVRKRTGNARTSLRGTLAELDRLHQQLYTGSMQHSLVRMSSTEAASALSMKHTLKRANMRAIAFGRCAQCLLRLRVFSQSQEEVNKPLKRQARPRQRRERAGERRGVKGHGNHDDKGTMAASDKDDGRENGWGRRRGYDKTADWPRETVRNFFTACSAVSSFLQYSAPATFSQEAIGTLFKKYCNMAAILSSFVRMAGLALISSSTGGTPSP